MDYFEIAKKLATDQGTPKSIKKAINDGLSAVVRNETNKTLEESVLERVRDFCAQKFTAKMTDVNEDALMTLFNEIFGAK